MKFSSIRSRSCLTGILMAAVIIGGCSVGTYNDTPPPLWPTQDDNKKDDDIKLSKDSPQSTPVPETPTDSREWLSGKWILDTNFESTYQYMNSYNCPGPVADSMDPLRTFVSVRSLNPDSEPSRVERELTVTVVRAGAQGAGFPRCSSRDGKLIFRLEEGKVLVKCDSLSEPWKAMGIFDGNQLKIDKPESYYPCNYSWSLLFKNNGEFSFGYSSTEDIDTKARLKPEAPGATPAPVYDPFLFGTWWTNHLRGTGYLTLNSDGTGRFNIKDAHDVKFAYTADGRTKKLSLTVTKATAGNIGVGHKEVCDYHGTGLIFLTCPENGAIKVGSFSGSVIFERSP